MTWITRRLQRRCARTALLQAFEPRRLFAAVSWDGGGDGTSWTDPLNWSANVLPTSADDVTIDVASNPSIVLNGTAQSIKSLVSNETLTITKALTVTNGVTFNATTTISSNAIVTVTGGLTLGGGAAVTLGSTTDNTYGQFNINGNVDNTIAGSGSITAVGNGTSYIVNNASDANGTKRLTIASGITIGGRSFFMYSGGLKGVIENDGTILPTGVGTSNQGTWSLSASGGSFINNGTMTLSGGVTVNSTNLVNNAGKTLTVNASTLTLAEAGGTPALSWTNAGTLASINGTINFGGDFTATDMGTITRSGGTLALTGTLENTASTFTLTDTIGDLVVGTSGVIKGGTVTRSGSAILLGVNGTLDGVTLNLPVKVAQNKVLNISNGLTLNSTLTAGDSSDNTYGQLLFNGTTDQTLGGTGNIVGVGNAFYLINNTSNAGVGKTLTIGSGISITSSAAGNIYSTGAIGGTLVNAGVITANGSGTWAFGNTSSTFTNVGTLDIAGATLALNGTWHNTGTINVASGLLNLAGTFGIADTNGIVHTGGTIAVTGTFDLGGGTFTFDANKGTWQLKTGGRIKNGTLTNVGANTLTATGGTLDGITLAMDLTLGASSQISVENNLTLSGATLTIGAGATNDAVLFTGSIDQTLGGTGSIVFGGTVTTFNAVTSQLTAGHTLTLASGISISGATGNISATTAGNTVIVNGPITAGGGTGGWRLGATNSGITFNNAVNVGANQTVSLVGAWHNAAGSLNINGGILDMGGTFTLADVGTMLHASGTVRISGTLDLAAGTLTLDDPRGSWGLFTNGRIANGTIARTGTNTLIPQGGTLDAIALNLPLMVSQNNILIATNGLTLNNVNITLGDAADNSRGQMNVGGTTDQSILGTGNILVVGTSTSTLLNATSLSGAGKTLTLASGINVTGRSLNFSSNTLGGAIISNGSLGSTVSGGLFTVGSSNGTFTSNGTLLAQGGSRVLISNVSGNLNAATIDGTSTLDVSGTYTINQPISVPTGALLVARGNWTKTAAINVDGAVVFDYTTTSPLASLNAQLAASYNGGAWTGGVFTSDRVVTLGSSYTLGEAESTSAFGVNGGTLGGVSIDATSILIRPVRRGDFNANGIADFNDLLLLAKHYNATSGALFSTGDSDYDGDVDFNDLLALAKNYGLADADSVSATAAATTRKREALEI